MKTKIAIDVSIVTYLNGTNINGLGKLGEYNTEDSF